MRNTVILPKREVFLFQRPTTRSTHRFQVADLEVQAEVGCSDDDEATVFVQESVRLLSQERLDQYGTMLSADLTMEANPIPSMTNCLTPHDVQVLEIVHRWWGGDTAARRLFIEKLKIPYRDRHGNIERVPAEVTRQSAYISRAVRRQQLPIHLHPVIVGILKSAQLVWDSHRMIHIMHFNQQRLQRRVESDVADRLQEMNKVQYPRLEEEVARMGGLLSLGHVPVITMWDVNAWNWAGKYGDSVGISLISYERWHDIWQESVEEQGGFLQIGWSQEKLDTGKSLHIPEISSNCL